MRIVNILIAVFLGIQSYQSFSQEILPLIKNGIMRETGLTLPQLWLSRCGKCHEPRTPDEYKKEQWQILMLHMRIRANLTAEEQQGILYYLRGPVDLISNPSSAK